MVPCSAKAVPSVNHTSGAIHEIIQDSFISLYPWGWVQSLLVLVEKNSWALVDFQ